MFFGYNQKKPYLTYSLVNKEGDLVRSIPITLSEPVMIHDMAITQNFTIFMELPLIFRPKEIVKGSAYVFDKSKKTRIGIIPRHATNEKEMKWFDISPCWVFHTVNAWEIKENEIILTACRVENFRLDSFEAVETEYQPFLYEWRLNITSGEVIERKLCDLPAEFPRIHPQLMGQPTRYGYSALLTPSSSGVNITGVFKYDFTENKVKNQITWGPGRTGGECVFVPRENATSEDDGYLLTYVYDENTQKSEFVVINAKTMSSDYVARVVLPQRVPAGFHGIFVSENEIQSQRNLK